MLSAFPLELQSILREKIKGKRICLPEGQDERVVQAASILQKDFLAKVILGGPHFAQQHKETTQKALQARGKEERFASLQEDIHCAAGGLLAAGEVDAVVSGCNAPTSQVLRAALFTVGTSHKLLTSCFMMIFPTPSPGGEEIFLFGDCAVIPEPTAEQLTQIGFLMKDAFACWTTKQPRVGFLSFSTAGSADHPATQKVSQAARLFREQNPNVPSPGYEVQFDAAIVPEVAQRKCPGDLSMPGNANVLVFPNLDAGNIAYKLAQRMGHAAAYGPILLGARKPFSDLSRGASVEDIVHTSVLTCALANSSMSG